MSESGMKVLDALLASGAIDRGDLEIMLTLNSSRPEVPTHREFLPIAEAACSRESLRTYRTTFRRLVVAFGDVAVDAISSVDLRPLALKVRLDSVDQKGGNGVGAEEGFIRGARRFYQTVKENGLRNTNPASEISFSRRSPRVRRALTSEEMEQIYSVVLETSHDPSLDVLILDFHRDTACRQGGATSLRIRDINYLRGSVLLHEKGGTERETPCARDILMRIDDLWKLRTDKEEDDFAFRYLDGTRLTRRRYNTIFLKVHNNLPWAKRLGVSSHWFRHTTLTDIAHATNGRIASAYAGHTSSRNSTDGYTRPAFEDLVSAHDLVFPSFIIGSPLQPNSPDLVQRATPTSPPSQAVQPFLEEPRETSL